MNDLSQQATLEKPAKAGLTTTDGAFVLHTYPYRETSAIAEVFTRQHGRIVLVAKGAKRPRSTTRGVLQPFQPLLLSWFGKAEMKTLKTAEQERILPQLSGAALLSAFYANELLLKLSHREDPHEVLFECYRESIGQLSQLAGLAPSSANIPAIAVVLRRFEVALLQELGYAVRFAEEVDTHAPIEAGREYAYQIERGPVALDRHHGENGHGYALQLSGKTLLDMAADDYRDPQTQVQAKQLMRSLINHLLGDKVLHTRNLVRELK